MLGASALLLIANFSLNESKKDRPLDDTVAEIRRDLIREIHEFDPHVDTNITSPSAPIPARVAPERNVAIERAAGSSKPDNYSIVGVVPELKREKYSREESTYSTRRQTIL